jgi:DNA primase
VLFGIDKAKLAIRKKGYAVVVEGQLDLLMSHQIGIDNTVAVSGTALSSSTVDANNVLNNLGLIRRMTSNVIFAFDGDSAGVRAAGRSALIALGLDMQVKIAVLPEGQDPADIIKQDPSLWKDILRNATNIISFYIDRICTNTDDARMRGRQIREIVFPYINAIKSAIDQSTYIKEINKKTNIPENALTKDFEVYQSTHKLNLVESDLSPNTNNANTEIGSRKSSIEKQLFGIVLQQESHNWPEDNIKKRIDEFINTIGIDIYNNLRKKYEVATETLSLETEMWYGGNNDKMIKDVSELALNLEEVILQERLIDIKNDMNNHEINGEIEKAKDLLKQYQEIVTRVQNIKSRRSQ